METTLAEISGKYNAQDRDLIERAFEFAEHAHIGQNRLSGEPYIIHPLRVAATIAELNLDAETAAAALLHDVAEDADFPTSDIEKVFGKTVAFLVEGVSKLKRVDFTGEESKAENFRKMILATAQDIRVVFIKLADVLDNMQTLGVLSPDRQTRYSREVLEIYAPIAERLGIGWLKGKLEDLAFPYIYPEEFKVLKSCVSELVKENKRYIEALTPTVARLLNEEKIRPVNLDSRVKHLYSLWKKLARHENDMVKIHDLVALRIIVEDIPACYAVLGTLHKNWTPLPGRIKDYIALPKPNGYRSLHTTVFCEDGKITEFQIRTPEMHREAEFGIAAHWAYKEKTGSFKPKLAWVEQLHEWQGSADPKEFLENLRIDFFRDRIFVFTPKGDVIDLPEGATPIDFAYAVHSDLGNRCSMAKVNSKPASFDTTLKNHDVVEIVTAKNKKPSSDWLTFVKTSKARGKIREALRPINP